MKVAIKVIIIKMLERKSGRTLQKRMEARRTIQQTGSAKLLQILMRVHYLPKSVSSIPA